MKSLILIALKNLRSYRRHNLKIILLMASLVTLITLFLAYLLSLSMKQEEMKNESISSNYIITGENINPSLMPNNAKKSSFHYFDISDLSSEYFGLDFDYISANYVELLYNSRFYEAIHPYLGINIFAGLPDEIFTENDFKELTLKYKKDNIIIGNFPKTADEILISEKLIKAFGLPSDILGEEISITSKINEEKIILESVRISGIIIEEYYELSGHTDSSSEDSFSPSILILNENSLFQEKSEHFIPVNRYTFEEFLTEKEAEILDKRYSNYHYVGRSTIRIIKDINSMQILSNRLFSLLGVAITGLKKSQSHLGSTLLSR